MPMVPRTFFRVIFQVMQTSVAPASQAKNRMPAREIVRTTPMAANPMQIVEK